MDTGRDFFAFLHVARLGKFKTLVDSGCSKSVMNRSLVRQHNLVTMPLNRRLGFRTAADEFEIITEVCYIRIKLSSQWHTFRFYVSDKLFRKEQLVLGLDFLRKFNPSINWRRQTMQIDGYLNLGGGQNTGKSRKTVSFASPLASEVQFLEHDTPEKIRSQLPLSRYTPKGHENDFRKVSFDESETWLREFFSVFAETNNVSGIQLPPYRPGFNFTVSLKEGTSLPPPAKLHAQAPEKLTAQRKWIEDLLAKKYIRPSRSPTAAAVHAVPKACKKCHVIKCVCKPKQNPEDKRWRIVIDFRPLNNVTVPEHSRIPLIEQLLQTAAGHKWYAKMDVKEAFHKIRVEKGHEFKLAMATHEGTFEWLVMPWGQINGPSFWQSFIDACLAGLTGRICAVYLDDIIIWADTEDELRDRIRQVLTRLQESNLQVEKDKCIWKATEIDFLGFIINQYGTKTDPRKLQTIQDWKVPVDGNGIPRKRDVLSIVMFANWYRKYIPRFSELVLPLTDLAKPSSPNVWTEQCQASFEALKAEFLSPSVLRTWDPSKPICIETDASDRAFAGVIMQEYDDGFHPVAFFSKKFSDAQRAWPTTHRELFAILYALTEFDYMMHNHQVTVYSDHSALQQFRSSMQLKSRLIRWSEELSNYDFVIRHRPGKLMQTDWLTRRHEDGPAGDAKKYGILLGERHWDAPLAVSRLMQCNLGMQENGSTRYPSFENPSADIGSSLFCRRVYRLARSQWHDLFVHKYGCSPPSSSSLFPFFPQPVLT